MLLLFSYFQLVWKICLLFSFRLKLCVFRSSLTMSPKVNNIFPPFPSLPFPFKSYLLTITNLPSSESCSSKFPLLLCGSWVASCEPTSFDHVHFLRIAFLCCYYEPGITLSASPIVFNLMFIITRRANVVIALGCLYLEEFTVFPRSTQLISDGIRIQSRHWLWRLHSLLHYLFC